MRPDATGRGFWRRSAVLAAAGALLAVLLGAAYMSIGHRPAPHEVPIAVVGPPVVAQKFQQRAPGAFDARAVGDLAAGRRQIEQRDVYAVVAPGPNGAREVVVSSAAGTQVATFLRRTLGQATAQNFPHVEDAKPLPADDSGNLSIGLLVNVLVIGGIVGVLGLSKLRPRIQADPRNGVLPAAFLAAYALLFGVTVAAVAQAFGVAADASFVDLSLALSLVSFGVITSTAALIALIGPAGAAVAAVVYFVLGTQISGAATAPEFLPSFWSGLGQDLPTGSAVSLLRDVVYFPDASTSRPVTVLAVYAIVGLAVLFAINLLRARRVSA